MSCCLATVGGKWKKTNVWWEDRCRTELETPKKEAVEENIEYQRKWVVVIKNSLTRKTKKRVKTPKRELSELILK